MADAETEMRRERYLYVVNGLIGAKMSVRGVDGSEWTGTFSTATPFRETPHRLVLKGFQVDESALATMVLDEKKIASAVVKCDLFASGGKKNGFEKTSSLEKIDETWLSSQPKKIVKKSSSGGKWDQFEANERLFDVKLNFDEDRYTTAKPQVTAKQEADAARVARSIESTKAHNSHIAEERGQASANDHLDEEDRFSGVIQHQKKSQVVIKKTPPVKDDAASSPTIVVQKKDDPPPPVPSEPTVTIKKPPPLPPGPPPPPVPVVQTYRQQPPPPPPAAPAITTTAPPTTTTKSTFKFNVDAAEFKPSWGKW